MSSYKPDDFGMNDVSVISRRDPSCKRITREEVTTLKMKVVSSQKRGTPLWYKAVKGMRSLMGMFTFGSGTMRNQCKTYGHVLPVGVKYASHNLICGECGSKIRSPQDLRTCNERSRETVNSMSR